MRGGWALAGAAAIAALLYASACGRTAPRSALEPYQRTAPVAHAGARLGVAQCETCHGHQPAPDHHGDCEACHGPGERHVANVMAEDGIRFPPNAECLSCHETGHTDLLAWSGSDHARAGLLCSDCHDPHNAEPWHLRVAPAIRSDLLPEARPGTRLCIGCHPEVASQLDLPSHHPVPEGMVACTDCHGPHASPRVRLGEATEACTVCHQAQQGPWIYEHTPVVEDCGYCHVPHGSAVSPLMAASQPGACAFCHSIAELGATHDPQAFVTNCTDCHGAVHGSFADPVLRR